VAVLRIPGDGGDFVSVSVSVPESGASDPRSEGWLGAEVGIKAGPWSGRYAAQFHEDDFLQFAEKLDVLADTLKGSATLSSLDGYLHLTLSGDGLGHISIAGEAWDRPGVASHLVLSFETDQTALPQLQAALAALTAHLTRKQ
jgi:hypothetical protein